MSIIWYLIDTFCNYWTSGMQNKSVCLIKLVLDAKKKLLLIFKYIFESNNLLKLNSQQANVIDELNKSREDRPHTKTQFTIE